MNTFREFPPHFMETSSHWSLRRVLLFMFLTTISKACQAPSSPQCFRTNESATVYMCEWSMNSTESDVTFDIYFSEKQFGGLKTTRYEINEEQLIKLRPVNIWVKAHIGNASCQSSKRTVILGHTVRYDAPYNITASWLKNNLSLAWKAAEKYPALAEVWFRRDGHHAEPWQKRFTNTTCNTSHYQVTVVNLLKDSAYQVQIRQRSNMAQNPLWSQWSSVLIVPAELEHQPEVTMTTSDLNGTRMVRLRWKPMPNASAVRGVKYSLQQTQSLLGCPCLMRKRPTDTHEHTYHLYVSYSAVNISVIARNPASDSPPAIIQVPSEAGDNIKACNKTLMANLNKKSCHEWYEYKEANSLPENVITLTRKKKPQERTRLLNSIKDYVRYLYFEHRCYQRKPQTVQMCLFYQKESVPNKEPQDFVVLSETPASAQLSWKAIPVVNQRGLLKHYNLCSIKISPQSEPKECYNVSASVFTYHLENLTPGSKYNITLAGLTEAGEGTKATVTINTLPEKPVNVWWSFGLLLAFFLISTQCTVILKRIKNKIFPPVPMPVIPDFNPCQLDSQQEMQEGKEEVHELKLEQLHPEIKSPTEDTETTPLRRQRDQDGNSRMSGEISEESGSSQRSCGDGDTTDLEQVDHEIAMLIYRNGLVFDLRTDSS